MRFELGQRIIDKIRKPFIRVKIKEIEHIKEVDEHFKLKELIDVYNNLLYDEYSRETYLNVLQYRLNSKFKIKSALPTPSNQTLNSITNEYGDKFEVFNGSWTFEAKELNLSPLGANLRFYGDPLYVYYTTNQYSYKNDGVDIDIKDGDVVIDGGGCYGDTALWFAHKIGKSGKVYSFEFVKKNLDIFHKSLNLNPHLKNRIKIVNAALYSVSESSLYVCENGAGTFCSTDKDIIRGGDNYTIKTKAIDDLVRDENLNNVHFIKMDIEGSELEALKGAKNTIQQYKPNLAICIYHKIEDFYMIPKYIKEIVPEYKLYVKHHTDGLAETVLYASIK